MQYHPLKQCRGMLILQGDKYNIFLWTKTGKLSIIKKKRVSQTQEFLSCKAAHSVRTPTWAWLHCLHATWGQRTDSVMIMPKLLAKHWILCPFSMTMKLHDFYQHPWSCSKVTYYHMSMLHHPRVLSHYIILCWPTQCSIISYRKPRTTFLAHPMVSAWCPGSCHPNQIQIHMGISERAAPWI